jgi:hypothetical protein
MCRLFDAIEGVGKAADTLTRVCARHGAIVDSRSWRKLCRGLAAAVLPGRVADAERHDDGAREDEVIDISKLDDWCVDNWRTASKWWSVRMNAIGAMLLPLLMLVPQMPAEIQALLPPAIRAIVAGLWCLLNIVVRLKSQKKVGG